jgi:hypothetical protein
MRNRFPSKNKTYLNSWSAARFDFGNVQMTLVQLKVKLMLNYRQIDTYDCHITPIADTFTWILYGNSRK